MEVYIYIKLTTAFACLQPYSILAKSIYVSNKSGVPGQILLKVNLNAGNTTCVWTIENEQTNGNQTASKYDERGALTFSASVIAIYGLSIALMIAMTVKRNQTDHEVKGFLRSFAELDRFRRQKEKNKVKQVLGKLNFRHDKDKQKKRGKKSRACWDGVKKSKDRHRRPQDERIPHSMNKIEMKHAQVMLLKSPRSPRSFRGRFFPELREDRLPSTSTMSEVFEESDYGCDTPPPNRATTML